MTHDHTPAAAPSAPAPSMLKADIGRVMHAAHVYAKADAARSIPTGDLYRGIALRQWVDAEAALRAEIDSYAAAREAAERERVRGVLRELVEAMVAFCAAEDEDTPAAEERLQRADDAARAELGDGR